MFRKSKWKIVAAVLSVLALVLGGTFCVIYLASYTEVSNENKSLLEQYAAGYSLREGGAAKAPDRSRPGGDPVAPPRLELSTFYSVAVSTSGQVLRVDTADIPSLDEDTLTQLALEILDSGKTDGVRHNLIYRVADKSGYQMVAFLDNTVMQESTRTLLSYTLIFSCAALVPLFFLAWYLAGRIVSPLEESYKRQKQFVSDAGHELKTPVAVVNANVELLSREIGENQWLSNIQYENERMSGLISQLLELARTENVKVPMETLDFSHLVLGEALPFETVAYENGLQLETDIAEGILLCGNDLQLRQLASILIDNAIRHSANGKAVVLRLRKEKNHAVFSVVNDGEQIPPEQQKHLFDRFYRGDESRTGDRHYGLGLAIAKAIAGSHHGTIQVLCARGKVEFLVRLPLQSRNHKN